MSTVAAASARGVARAFVIGLTAFLTVVDLFATQALLPSLARVYGVSPGAMGLAVNACTLGMAVAGLGVALAGARIDRRRGILVSLVVLAVPTSLLSVAPDIATFAALRVWQGLCMAAAFTLTLSHLGEHGDARDTAGAFAAYITGNVASNLFGRLFAAGLADHFGLAANFHVFAALNLLGAVLVHFTIDRAPPMPRGAASGAAAGAAWLAHLRNPELRATFAIGFLILFAFIGTFTYVNFTLVRAPFGVSMMGLGFVYLVFAPAIATTPVAGRAAARLGAPAALVAGFAAAGAGLALLLLPWLAAALAGLVLVGIGTFFAQAVATGHVGRVATADRGAASGVYLASYFLGGLVGSFALGRVFDGYGWTACVAAIGAALLLAAILSARLRGSPPT
ncbi:MAG: MFS transporter [Rhodospirillales bacterium]|nr:MAG: MFS transporter [Rhodospirillales bacterium]